MSFRKLFFSFFCVGIPKLILATEASISSEAQLDMALRDPSTTSIYFEAPLSRSSTAADPAKWNPEITLIDGQYYNLFRNTQSLVHGFKIHEGVVTIRDLTFNGFASQRRKKGVPLESNGLGEAVFIGTGATVNLENVIFTVNTKPLETDEVPEEIVEPSITPHDDIIEIAIPEDHKNVAPSPHPTNRGKQNSRQGPSHKPTCSDEATHPATQQENPELNLLLESPSSERDLPFEKSPILPKVTFDARELGAAVFIREGGTANFKGSVVFEGHTIPSKEAKTEETMGADIYMMSRAQCNFDLSEDLVLKTPIEGNLGVGNQDSCLGGGIKKTGYALLSLTGENTYSGITDIQEGELQINGSVTSDIEVNGGILSGAFSTVANRATGTSGSLTLNRGRFEPGVLGIGKVSLAGAFEQNGGTFSVDITPDPLSDKVFHNAGAIINGGELEVFMGPGNYIAGTVYTIIEGETSGAGYDEDHIVKVGRNATTVDIDVRLGSLEIEILSSHLFLDQEITSPVAKEVVKCITGEPIEPNSDFAHVVELLGVFVDVDPYLDRLAPTQFSSLEWINARNQSLVAGVLSDHLLELCCTNRNCCDPCSNATFWIAGYANFVDQNEKLDQLTPFDSTSAGIVLGFDRCCCNWILGGAAGYTYSEFNWYQQHTGKGRIDSFYGSIYASYNPRSFALDFSLIGGGSDHHVSRRISFPGLHRKAKSDLWGYFLTAHAGGRGTWECGCFGLEGFALADYHYFNREAFSESGAESLNLAVLQHTQHLMRGEAGLRAYYSFVCYYYCFAPYLGASWVGDFPLNTSVQKARFRGRNCVMDINAYNSSIQMGSPEIGIRLTYDCGPTMLIGYKGLFGKEVRMNQVDVRFEWAF